MTDVDASEGTLTFAFTDIEGSTQLLRALGTAYADVLQAHDEIIRTATNDEGGRAFGSEGDAQNLVFADAAAAVRAAVQVQRALAARPWPDGQTVRIRIGIHSGNVQRSGDQYVGLVLHETARLSAAGHGGQVLLSPVVLELARDELPDGVTTRDLGEHRLKDLDAPVRIHQLDIAGLQTSFPPLRTLGPAGSRLPTPVTSFVGRGEVEVIADLASRSRLLTLTGPGGTGKTRLSIEVAATIAADFVDGTFFVSLDAVTDAALVASEMAATLGLVAGSEPPMDRLLSHLRGRKTLLVLDNFEQVLDAADDVATLMRECPGVSFLVTSRIPLRIYGEQEFPVPGLALPPTDVPVSGDEAASYEAVRLFVERARAARAGFALDDANAVTVVDIVSRLDGLPLGIELAAARLRILPLDTLRQRLDERLSVLIGGARDLPNRQRTLRGAIEWSHDLLDEPERRLFARFGVVAGSAAVDQIDSICGPAEELGRDVFESLESLDQQSLIRSIEGGDGIRFGMLATIREYAVEQLVASSEAELIRRRHALTYLELAERAQPELIGPDAAEWNDRVEMEHDNLRVALDWVIEAKEAELGLRLVTALWRFWQVRGHLHEGAERADRVLAMPSVASQPAALRSRAEAAAGSIAYWRSQIQTMHAHYSMALEQARRSGDESLLAEALYNQGFAPSDTDFNQVDRYRIGQPFFEEALELYRKLGDRAGEASALWALSQSAMSRQDRETADRLGVESLVIARELGDPFRIGWAAFTVGLDRLSGGIDEGVEDLLREALEVFASSGDAGGLTLCFMAAAMLARERGDEPTMWRLVGASIRSRDDSGTDLLDEDTSFGSWDPNQRPDSPQSEAQYAEGHELSTEAAIALARSVLG